MPSRGKAVFGGAGVCFLGGVYETPIERFAIEKRQNARRLRSAAPAKK